jgi:hypothetical protein
MPQTRTPATRPATLARRSARAVLGLVVAAVVLVPAGAATAGPTGTTASTTSTSTAPGAPSTTAATSAPVAPQALGPAVTSVSAYWVVASDGGVFSFGGAPFYGSTGNIRLNRPVVGMAATSPSDSGGYREVATDGGIFAYGDARFFGSTGNIRLNQPIVGMAATSDGQGYWLVAADGGVFTFGDAQFDGSTGNLRLNRPIVGMAATADNGGYWLVAADGGIFAFGDAVYYGSTGNLHLQQPVVGMASTHDHKGYWMVAADGGIFAFGDAGFHGSLGGVPQSRPIVSMTASASGGGYWFTNNNGAVTAFGDATYWGSAPQVLAAPVVGITQGTGNGSFTGSSYPSGSYGYDISNWQCGNFPPPPHTIGIVEVVGQSFGTTNPCLAQEAAWAGGGLNLYIYLTNGTAPTSGDTACTGVHAQSCNYGFNAAIDAFTKARNAHINTQVGWWLDVEPQSSGWTSDTAANAAVVQGALDGLHWSGLNSPGIYTSPLSWPGIVGNYAPSTPLWLAWYTNNPQQNCATGMAYAASHGSHLPTGGLQITQYGVGTYDQDYAC